MKPPSPPPGVNGDDDDVLCMALIGTGETLLLLCSTETPADRLLLALPEFRSIAAARNRLLCAGGAADCCCCELALVIIDGDDLIEGECRSRIE